MLRKSYVLLVLLGLFSLVAQADHATLFKLRIENVSPENILMSRLGETAPAGLSPGLIVLYDSNVNPVFVPGKAANGTGLERLAEDGNPEPLAGTARKSKGVKFVQIFNTPNGSEEPGAIGPGGVYELTFTAHPGSKLMLAQMFGQSNDLFYAPDSSGISLFDSNGTAISGDLTGFIRLWDAGTEVNQEPGFGADQAPRQPAPNTGAEEQGTIGTVRDGFTYPAVNQVLKITLTHQ